MDGVVKAGDLYLFIANKSIVDRAYIPQHCFSLCTSASHPDCDCAAVSLVNQISLAGKLVKLEDCLNSVIRCIEAIYR